MFLHLLYFSRAISDFKMGVFLCFSPFMFVLLGSRSTKLLMFHVWKLLFILAVGGNVGGTSLEHLQLYTCCGRDMIQAVYFYGGDIHL